MKTRWMLSGLLLGSSLALVACGGAGTYQIPPVEPVVKPKAGDDLLESISGDDKTAAPSESSAPATSAEPAPAPTAAPAGDSSKTPDTAKKK
jgi:hypothetical protein